MTPYSAFPFAVEPVLCPNLPRPARRHSCYSLFGSSARTTVCLCDHYRLLPPSTYGPGQHSGLAGVGTRVTLLSLDRRLTSGTPGAWRSGGVLALSGGGRNRDENNNFPAMRAWDTGARGGRTTSPVAGRGERRKLCRSELRRGLTSE